MKRTPLQRKSRIKRGKQLVKSRIKRKRRKPSEFQRIYGSRERVSFVKGLPCILCGGGYCDGHHIETGGTGHKAHYTKIVPLCRGCHNGLHIKGRETWQQMWGIDLEQEAANTEKLWQATLTERNTG